MRQRESGARKSERARARIGVLSAMAILAGVLFICVTAALATEKPEGSSVDVTPDGTTTVGVGDTVNYTATCTCSGTHNLHWTGTAPGLSSGGSGSTITLSGTVTTPGTYTISAACDATSPAHGSDSATLKIEQDSFDLSTSLSEQGHLIITATYKLYSASGSGTGELRGISDRDDPDSSIVQYGTFNWTSGVEATTTYDAASGIVMTVTTDSEACQTAALNRREWRRLDGDASTLVAATTKKLPTLFASIDGGTCLTTKILAIDPGTLKVIGEGTKIVGGEALRQVTQPTGNVSLSPGQPYTNSKEGQKSITVSSSASCAGSIHCWEFWLKDPSIGCSVTASPAYTTDDNVDYDVLTVALVWASDASVWGAAGWEAGYTRTASGCYSGRSASVNNQPGKTYGAALWFPYAYTAVSALGQNGPLFGWTSRPVPPYLASDELGGGHTVLWP